MNLSSRHVWAKAQTDQYLQYLFSYDLQFFRNNFLNIFLTIFTKTAHSAILRNDGGAKLT